MVTLCLGDIIGDWNAAQAFGMVSASVLTVIAVTYSGILFLQYIIARDIVWSSAGSDSGEGMPVGVDGMLLLIPHRMGRRGGGRILLLRRKISGRVDGG